MSSNIHNYITACGICLKFSKSKVKEPLVKIGIDIAEVEGRNYLIVMDYYSRWLEILKLNFKKKKSSHEEQD